MDRSVTNCPCLPTPQASNIPPNFRRHKQGRRSVPRPIRRTIRGPRRLIVVWLNFWTGIDGPIWSSHRDSARVSNPPAGRISPRICTPINGAATPSPVRIGPHPSTTTSIMVLWWGGRGGFVLLNPQPLQEAWVDGAVGHGARLCLCLCWCWGLVAGRPIHKWGGEGKIRTILFDTKNCLNPPSYFRY